MDSASNGYSLGDIVAATGHDNFGSDWMGMFFIFALLCGFGNGGFDLPPATIHNYIVPLQKEVAAEMGCDIATIPFNVLDLMLKHPKTDEGIAKFKADYEKVNGSQ